MFKFFRKNLFLLLCLFIFSSHATENHKNILYEIRKENSVVGHLLGVMHAFPVGKEFSLLPSTIDAVSRSDGVFTELGLSQFLLLEKSAFEATQTIRGNQRLSSVLPATLISQLNTHLRPLLGDNTKELIENTHPWAISQILFTQLCKVRMNPVQMEAELLLLASRKEKPVMALESIQDQVNVLPAYNSPIWPEHLNAILKLIARPDCSKKYTAVLENLSDAFIAGKVDSLLPLIQESYSLIDTSKLEEVSIFSRNPQLFSRILKRVESGRFYFFAVGANHLIGPTGLISSFEKNGYIVKRIE
ncbi:MAG: TraB/GumN family protein [Burkholderiaceae bacterium]|nr:TraB/GumN family protein [Burkholderiaceae bacterium]